MEKRASLKIILPVLVLILLTIGFLLWKHFAQGDFNYAGTLEATRVDLPSRLATVIESIDVQEGDRVQSGQKLASLACEELKIQGELIDDNFRRSQHLYRSGGISQEAFEKVKTSKDDSDTRLSWCSLTAPFDGSVMTRYLEPKEWVNPGGKILALADVDHPWAYFYVPQEVMSHLKVGSAVTGSVPEMDGQSFHGKIIKINDEAEFTPKNVQTRAERTRLVFGVKALFDNKAGLLKPGMTIESELRP